MKHQETTELAIRPSNIELLFPDHPLLKHFEDFQRQIAQRAYEIFQDSGFTDGHDLDDWLKAESEFLHPAPVDVQESDSEYLIHVEVPGFQEKEIQIAVDQHQLVVRAQHTSQSEHKKDKILRSEQQSKSICRSFPLPSNVDVPKVTKHLRDGILEIKLPKAAAGKPSAKAA